MCLVAVLIVLIMRWLFHVISSELSEMRAFWMRKAGLVGREDRQSLSGKLKVKFLFSDLVFVG